MVYKGKTERGLLFSLVSFQLICIINTSTPTVLKIVSILFFIIILFISLIKYTLIIHNNTIVYNMSILTFKIFSKEIKNIEIKTIIFKRIDWKSKMAIIKMNKGFSIRIALFSPDTVYQDLEDFCVRNSVNYKKTKDYILIEKMS